MADRRLYLGVAASLRGCSPGQDEALHSALTYRLQLEVIETQMLMLPRLASALAQAMQVGHKSFDTDALPTVVQQAYDNVLNGLPYMVGPGGEQSAIERERQSLIKRAKDRRDRLLQGREPRAPEAPKLKPVPVGKRNVGRT